MCHLDICPEGDAGQWTYPPYSGEIDAQTNAIYGRGAMDNKAAVAICLGLMRVIVERQLQFDGDLLFQFVLEDEITGNGTLACLEAGHLADAAIILDGTRPDRAIDQHAGNLEFRLNVTGRPAQFGRGIMQDVAAKMLADFADCLSRTLAETPADEAPAPALDLTPAVGSVFVERLRRLLRRLVGRRS